MINNAWILLISFDEFENPDFDYANLNKTIIY